MFNFTTDGYMRVNGMRVVKNMGDLLFYHKTLEGAIKELESFLKFCVAKNLKLKPSNFVEFGSGIWRRPYNFRNCREPKGGRYSSQESEGTSLTEFAPAQEQESGAVDLLRDDGIPTDMGTSCDVKCYSHESSYWR